MNMYRIDLQFEVKAKSAREAMATLQELIARHDATDDPEVIAAKLRVKARTTWRVRGEQAEEGAFPDPFSP